MKRCLAIWVLLTAGCTNRAPDAHAGFDQFAVVGRTAILDGSRSRDPDGDSLRYRWEADPDGLTFSSRSEKRVEVNASAPGQYEITLRVSDGTASSVDRTTLYVDSAPHVLVGSRTAGTPILEFDHDFGLVREFIPYSSDLELWPVLIRRSPDGTVLVLEEAEALDRGCRRSVERYSSGGEHIETVYPRDTSEDCVLGDDPIIVYETAGSIAIVDNARLKVIQDGDVLQDTQLIAPGAPRDLVRWNGTLFLSSIISFSGTAGVSELSNEGAFVQFVLDSSQVGYPGLMDVLPTGEIAVANSPAGVVFRVGNGVLSAFESTPGSEDRTGVGISPFGAVWAVSSQSVARTDSSGSTLFSTPLVSQPIALSLIY